jgi:hypothetical protein
MLQARLEPRPVATPDPAGRPVGAALAAIRFTRGGFMRKRIERLPAWLLLLAGCLSVAILGYIDYLAGDYSMLIFYFLPVSLMAWTLGRSGTALISLASGVARFVSDYNSYSSASVKYWNSFQDTAFLMIVGILIAMIKKLLNDEQE